MPNSKHIVEAFHMGPRGIKELDPAFQGEGADRRKFMKTGKPQTQVSHAYLEGANPEEVVLASSGDHKHKLKVDMSKMYNMFKDEAKHMARAQQDMANGNYEGNPIDAQDLARTRIKEEGYHGIHRPHLNSVELFHKTDLYAKGGKVTPSTEINSELPPIKDIPRAKTKFTSKDTHSFMPHNESQQALIHGIDLTKVQSPEENTGSTGDYAISGKAKNKNGKAVYVKQRIPDESLGNYMSGKAAQKENMKFSTAQREGLYHNLANHLGMGSYIPTTSVIKDGDNHYSAMEMVPGGEHMEYDNPEHQQEIRAAHRKGDLHKLAIMNTLLGNTDRHGGNFMISPEGLKLIDHGLTFDFHGGKSGREVFTPAYLRGDDEDYSELPVHHKAAEWLQNIKTEDLTKFFKSHKVPAKISSSVIRGLQAAKNHVKSEPDVDLEQLLDTIRGQHGLPIRKKKKD